MHVILATQEAEIRRIIVRSQARQLVSKTLSQKENTSQRRVSGVAQCEGPEFKPQYHKKKRKNFCVIGHLVCVEKISIEASL
jgi:hypothetical protein